jgi:predicted O-linked N-acetylglucosamine transferase (SPINDLY family)
MIISTVQQIEAPLSPEQQLEHDIATVMSTALAHHHACEFDDARALYEAILIAKEDHPDANYNLGVLFVQTERAEDALPRFEAALGVNPNNGQYWAGYVDALVRAGQLSAAWIALDMGQQRGLHGSAVDGLIIRMSNPTGNMQTVAVPAATQAPQQLGESKEPHGASVESKPAAGTIKALSSSVRKPTQQELLQFATLYNKGRVVDAIKVARKLTERYPTHGVGYRSLGFALHRVGQYEEAFAPLLKATQLLPEDIEARILLADLHRQKGTLLEAESLCRRTIEIHRGYAEAYRILGVVLGAQGRSEEALQACRRAIELAPKSGDAYGTLAVTLLEVGSIPEAEENFRRALEINPMDDLSHSNFLFCLTHNADLDAQQLFDAHREFAKRHETPVQNTWPKHANARNPDRALRVGLVSGDLFRHAVATYVEPVIKHLAQDASLSLYVYYNFVREDAATERLRGYATCWTPVTGMSHAALAERIRADGIDILIDLSGHTGRNRLLTFARKPAPVQASWIGYPATTGLAAMDYYLADRFLVPAGEFETQFMEKIARLPAIAPFLPEAKAPPINILPALHNGFVTFGSFNRLNKLSREVIALWAQLLRDLPTSRMIIGSIPKAGDESTLVKWFADEGISSARLSFRYRSDMSVYLQQLHHVDLCLDTFPYAGSTTTLHGLWMGVPTLTMPGQTVPSRGSSTWLSHLGLDAFIARDKADFVARALSVAADQPALNTLRMTMRERCMESAAFRPEVIAAGLSRALRVMWQRWCEQLPAESFEVLATDVQIAAHDATVGPGHPHVQFQRRNGENHGR